MTTGFTLFAKEAGPSRTFRAPRLKTAVVFWWRYSPHGSIATGKGRLIK